MRTLESGWCRWVFTAIAALLALAPSDLRSQHRSAKRPVVGVAFGGGSALGLAHVGVIRWLEEHRVPIDVVAGTSMGGLVGGAFATGMSSGELRQFLETTNWRELFGSSPYRFKSIARKQDVRAYPSRLELEVRRRIAFPSALNNGQQVDLLLAGLGAPYAGLPTFDSLPTPFRSIAVDVRTAERVVLDRGSLALALRATMSLPGIFPPVELGERVLIDGGVMDNVPADVVRDMGADVVLAVNVGRLPGTREVNPGLFAMVSSTVNAMIRASTRRGLADADIIVNPILESFGRFDWTSGDAMALEGYKATAAMGPALLRFAVDEVAWRDYLARRAAKRRSAMPTIAAVEVSGATPAGQRLMQRRLAPLVGRPLDTKRLKRELVRFAASDRYQSVWWDLRDDAGRFTLIVRARVKENAPPLAMFTTNVQNMTSDDFTFQLAARYLIFDALVPGGELRADIALGSNPRLGAEWRRPIGASGLFAAIGAGALRRRRSLAIENTIVAQYDQRLVSADAGLGMTFGMTSELRGDVRVGHMVIRPRVGDPRLPSMSGPDAQVGLRWIYDAQTHHIAPTSGLRLLTAVRSVLMSPDPPASSGISATNDGLVQADVQGSYFWSARGRRDRVFVTGGGGTSFGGHPLATDQFQLGLPFRLDGFSVGERRGAHFAALTGGYLYGLSRLPEFFGGDLFVGAWLENGAAFDALADATLETQLGAGMLVETLVGPALLGATIGAHGARRLYVGFGGIFP